MVLASKPVASVMRFAARPVGAHSRRPVPLAARMRMALMPKSEPIADFVHRQNVERYRRLLQTPLDTQQRQVILDLLAREEAVERQVLAQVKAMPGLEVCTDVSDLYQFSHSAAEENAALRQGKLAKMGGGAVPAIRSIRWTLSCRRDVDR
jgi:hypothetical protein